MQNKVMIFNQKKLDCVIKLVLTILGNQLILYLSFVYIEIVFTTGGYFVAQSGHPR